MFKKHSVSEMPNTVHDSHFLIDFFSEKCILKMAGAISLAGGLGSRSSPSASGATIGLQHEEYTLPLLMKITAASSR